MTTRVAANFCLGMLQNGSYSNCYAAIQDEVAAGDIPIAAGLLATIYFLTASFSGWLLVTAASLVGWSPGAMLVYTAPFWICAIVFFFSRGMGRIKLRTLMSLKLLYNSLTHVVGDQASATFVHPCYSRTRSRSVYRLRTLTPRIASSEDVTFA